MTDNSWLKKDSEELLDKVISFKRKYMVHNFRIKDSSPSDLLERELRMILFACRTDEENEKQSDRDNMC